MPDISERDSAIIELSKAGVTHAVIAAQYQISIQRVGQIVNKRAQRRHDSDVRYIRDLQRKRARLEKLISDPMPKSTATGQSQLRLDTCTCGSLADRRKDHGADCQVKVAIDQSALIAAEKEHRFVLMEIHKTELPDRETEASEDYAAIQAFLDESQAELDRLRRENYALRAELGLDLGADLGSKAAGSILRG